jgi:hypothetical protein
MVVAQTLPSGSVIWCLGSLLGPAVLIESVKAAHVPLRAAGAIKLLEDIALLEPEIYQLVDGLHFLLSDELDGVAGDPSFPQLESNALHGR